MAPNFFNRKKRLADYSYDELLTERTRLEAAEQKTLRELQKLEEEKARRFERAKQATSSSEREVEARKIRDISHRIDGLQGNIRRLGKLMRVVDLTMARLEQGRLARESSPLVKAIADTDALGIQDWADRVMAGEAVVEQKLDDLLKALGEAEETLARPSTGDAEVDAILDEIERAAATEALAREKETGAGQAPESPSA
jgi:hypothetical protein